MGTVLDTPCREYQGSRHVRGYGKRNRRVAGVMTTQLMHRWVWEQINGPIPPGMVVMHRCDNPPCFRYDHLMLGTQTDNLADMTAKGRRRNSHTGPASPPEPKRGRLADRDHCKNGHLFTPDNTCVDKRGWRSCRQCRRDSDRRRRT